ncbi:MAG: hypothetical protein WDZ96_08170, partial [Acidimicrobiia bacterium]
MTPTIKKERPARHRTGLLTISSGLVPGDRPKGWRVPGEMESAVAPNPGNRSLVEYQHSDLASIKGARSQTKDTTTPADRRELECGRTPYLYAFRA